MPQIVTDQQISEALENCAREPVHIPGTIQSQGTLIACRLSDGTITHAADNVADYVGKPAADLFGTNLADVFGREIWHSVKNAVALPDSRKRRVIIDNETLENSPCEIHGFVSDDRFVLEIADSQHDTMPTGAFLDQTSQLINRMASADGETALMETTVDLLRTITGYDRVMAYRFDSDFNGEVVAESRKAKIEPFLGLRFPKWDIPEQARNIMLVMPFRCIFDIDASPFSIRSADDADGPLDISLGLLRGVSPVHIQYLRNMDVRGTMTLSVRVDGALWGLISFHHRRARNPTSQTRQICEAVLPFIEARLALNLKNAEVVLAQKFDSLRDKVAEGFRSDLHLDDIISKVADPVLSAFDAHGLVFSAKDENFSSGEVPSAEVQQAVTDRARANCGTPFATECLAEQVGAVVADDEKIAGALVMCASEDQTFSVYRLSREQTVTWAGAPEKDIQIIGDNARLSPRGSFSAYAKTVQGHSDAWTQRDFQLFERLVKTIVSSVERHTIVETQKRQQELMIGELNHRVRNILALIRSVSRQARAHHGSLESYRTALEKRILALAAAHDIATGGAIDAVSLKQIILVEAEPFITLSPDRFRLRGDDALVKADKSPIVALVIHELMTNAAKYGALSSDNGSVDIDMKRGDGLELRWVERGGPSLKEPERRGFGTKLIESAIPFEFGGRSELHFAPDGVSASFWLPEDTLDAGDAVVGEPVLTVVSEIDDLGDQGNMPSFVLVVEDNFMIAKDLVDCLMSMNIPVVESVSNEADAMEILDSEDVSMAVLDINLGGPDRRSFSIAACLKEKNVPFFFVTGYSQNVHMPDDFKDVAVLTKPVEETDLLNTIKTIRKAPGPDSQDRP